MLPRLVSPAGVRHQRPSADTQRRGRRPPSLTSTTITTATSSSSRNTPETLAPQQTEPLEPLEPLELLDPLDPIDDGADESQRQIEQTIQEWADMRQNRRRQQQQQQQRPGPGYVFRPVVWFCCVCAGMVPFKEGGFCRGCKVHHMQSCFECEQMTMSRVLRRPLE